jgi:hypothetical protein
MCLPKDSKWAVELWPDGSGCAECNVRRWAPEHVTHRGPGGQTCMVCSAHAGLHIQYLHFCSLDALGGVQGRGGPGLVGTVVGHSQTDVSHAYFYHNTHPGGPGAMLMAFQILPLHFLL